MDWQQIEKDFKNWVGISTSEARSTKHIFNWFKQRIESEQPPNKSTEEESDYTTTVTADIKAKYGG